MISLVPEATWMVYCERGEVWGIEGMGNAGLIKDAEPGLGRARGAGSLGSSLDVSQSRLFRPCPFCFRGFPAVFQTCSILLLYISSTQAFVFCCSLQACLSTSISTQLCKKGQLQCFIHWDPFTNLLPLLSPLLCFPSWT